MNRGDEEVGISLFYLTGISIQVFRVRCYLILCPLSPLYPNYQNEFGQHHSTKTGLLCIKSSLLNVPGSQWDLLLISIDLSSAFGTVNPSTLQKNWTKDVKLEKVLWEFSTRILIIVRTIAFQLGMQSQATVLHPQGYLKGPFWVLNCLHCVYLPDWFSGFDQKKFHSHV